MTLTNIDAVTTYIQHNSSILNLDASHEYEIQELTGGTANWVFRVTDKNDGSTSVIKHAEDYVRLMPSMRFASDRMDYEAKVLQTLQHVLPTAKEKQTVVAPARFLAYDQDAKLLRISDGGERTLKAAYIANSPLNMREAGAKLGTWLADLHKRTHGVDVAGDHQTAKTIYRHSYNNLASALEEYGYDKSIGERINQEFGGKLQTDTGQLCHGDFWTGNVLVQTAPLRLTVVDWEMTRHGNGATDVGQFAAEAWLLDRFHGQKGLLDAFVVAYRAAQDEAWDNHFEDRRRIYVHFAVHIAYWPTRVVWGDRAATTELVRLGHDMLVHALDQNPEWFNSGPLVSLFQTNK